MTPYVSTNSAGITLDVSPDKLKLQIDGLVGRLRAGDIEAFYVRKEPGNSRVFLEVYPSVNRLFIDND